MGGEDAASGINVWTGQSDGSFVYGDATNNSLANEWWHNREKLIGDVKGDQLDEIIVLSGDASNSIVATTIATGNDTLSGGLGEDTFIFRQGDGQDTITDFEGLVDQIVFSTGGAVTLEDVAFYDTHLGLQIVYGVNDVITIQNATLATLPQDDLIFA